MSKRFCIRVATAVGGLLLLACASPVLSTPSLPQEGVPLVIDHTTADLSQIPAEWLAQARLLSLQLAHTSHGSQLVTGVTWWEEVRPELDVDIRSAVTPPGPVGALNIYDGNDYGEDTYITPEMYWSTEEGRAHTEQVAATGIFGYSIWSWCGQQSENSEEQVNDYLATLAQFEANHPSMRFIYMTGHTDGGSETLARNNQMVRAYVVAHGKVLFDFADLEQYDPAGRYYPLADDSCVWCAQWCSDHPADCAGLPEEADWCAHTHPLLCRQKGQAFWWMMARLAGWPGPEGAGMALYLPVVAR